MSMWILVLSLLTVSMTSLAGEVNYIKSGGESKVRLTGASASAVRRVLQEEKAVTKNGHLFGQVECRSRRRCEITASRPTEPAEPLKCPPLLVPPAVAPPAPESKAVSGSDIALATESLIRASSFCPQSISQFTKPEYVIREGRVVRNDRTGLAKIVWLSSNVADPKAADQALELQYDLKAGQVVSCQMGPTGGARTPAAR